MTDFARFNPPTIVLVHNDTDSASKTRRGLGSWTSDVVSAAGSAETAAESLAGEAATAVETAVSGAASAVETAVGAAASAAEAEADKIIDEIGDTLEDIEDAVIGLMEKVLDTIQDTLNSWLQETVGALDDIDIPRKMTLHLTTYCSAPGNDSTSDSNSTVSTKSTCNQIFSRGGATDFNNTTNNGTIFGFQPGAVVAKALGVFFVPESAQLDIREPVDNAANSVEKLLQEAGNDLSSWSLDLLFMPIVAVYIVAAVLTALLLVILLAVTVYSVRARESLPPRVYSLCGLIAALAAFFLLMGSVILTVIGLVTWVVGLGLHVVDIHIESGSKLKWMSWAAFIVMAVLAATLKIEEWVAEVVFWYNFMKKLFGKGKNNGGVKEDMRGA